MGFILDTANRHVSRIIAVARARVQRCFIKITNSAFRTAKMHRRSNRLQLTSTRQDEISMKSHVRGLEPEARLAAKPPPFSEALQPFMKLVVHCGNGNPGLTGALETTSYELDSPQITFSHNRIQIVLVDQSVELNTGETLARIRLPMAQ